MEWEMDLTSPVPAPAAPASQYSYPSSTPSTNAPLPGTPERAQQGPVAAPQQGTEKMPDVPPALFYPYYTSNQSGAPPGPNEAPVSSTTNNNGGNGGAISQSSSGDYSAILAQAGGHPTWGAQNGDSRGGSGAEKMTDVLDIYAG